MLKYMPGRKEFIKYPLAYRAKNGLLMAKKQAECNNLLLIIFIFRKKLEFYNVTKKLVQTEQLRKG